MWLLMVALIWLFGPGVVRSQLEKEATKAIGRTVQIDKVNLSPWSLEAEMLGLRVKAADGQTDALSVRRAYANASVESVWRLAPVVEQIVVEGLSLRVARLADGRYDVDDVFEILAKRPKSEKPARFALYNLSLQRASIDFDDRPAGKRHEVRDLTIGVPFLSTLSAHVKVDVAPRLAFKLNGSAFDTAAEGTPFAQTRAGVATLKFSGLNLSPYLPYLPERLPLRLVSAVLGADLKLEFAQPESAPAQLKFSGRVMAADVALLPAKAAQAGSVGVAGIGVAANGSPWLAWEQLSVGLKDVQPLVRQADFADVSLRGARIWVERGANGQLNWQRLAAAQARPAGPSPAAAAQPGASVPPWRVGLDKLQVLDAAIRFSDATVPGKPFQAALLDTQVSAGPVRWAGQIDVDVPLEATTHLALGGQTTSLAQLNATGLLTDQRAQVGLQLRDLSVAALQPYWADRLAARVQGSVRADMSVTWASGRGASTPSLVVSANELLLSNWAVTQIAVGTATTSAALPQTSSVAQLGSAKAAFRIDVPMRRLEVAQLVVDKPVLRLWRDAQGALWPGLLTTPVTAVEARSAPADAPAKPAPWAVRLADVQVSNGLLNWRDAAAARSVTMPAPSVAVAGAGASPRAAELEVSRIRLSARSLATDQLVDAPVQFSAVVGGARQPGPRNDRDPARTATVAALNGNAEEAPGQVAWRGNLGWKPGLESPSARGALTVRQLPLARFERYSRAYSNVDLLRGQLNFKGDVVFALPAPGAPDLQIKGDLNLADLQANSVVPAEPLLTWQSLAVNGLAVSVKAGALESVDVRDTSLTDFFARLIVTPEGRFNLQDLLKKPAESATAVTGTATAAVSIPGRASASATASPTVAVTTATTARPAPRITVGASSLVNGRVNFSDRFVRPNYSASLSELTGRVGAFSSVKATGPDGRTGELQMADVELRGKAEGTALLDIRGKINPAASPLALDIKGKVTDLELAPLTPYAAKYAGYAIERGKLSVDVSYKIEPDGKLTANNNVVLNQLTFGERIESPTATKLPVLFAVALLKDRNGVIDVNLPISGSLNDPQFSIGGIVWRIIGNLIVRAITAPFSLLSAAFGGGGEDLSFVEFAPGSTELAASGRTRLDSVAKALADRPALKLTVTGQADPADERDAAKKLKLDQLVVAEKRRELARDGSVSGTATVTVEPAELERYTRAAYRRMDFAGKPRNLVGLLRDLPLNEMNALMLANIQVTQDDMRALALQRGVAVRDYLLGKGVPSERMFLANPRLRGSAGDADNASAPAAAAAPGVPPAATPPDGARWTPRVQLSLGA
jgi:hypothetical protein